ncbi:MAG: DUF1059 domain-containing protein [Actinomycetota bacterium]|nr:DUF1059 domain-containing protein [Actinomycetota bacterium]
MKAFACGDVVPHCEATWVGASEDEILSQVRDHARSVHGLAEIPTELLTEVRARIVTET